LTQHLQALVHSPTAGRRIDPAHLDFMSILAANPNTEGELTRSERSEVDHLSRD
jgi:hypothetical protein